MESAFGIVAEPNRRAILSLLASSERSVSEIEQQLRMPQPSVSKHLRVLREAGFVEARVDAQRRVYRIRPEPLMEVDAWLAPFRRFWSTRSSVTSIAWTRCHRDKERNDEHCALDPARTVGAPVYFGRRVSNLQAR